MYRRFKSDRLRVFFTWQTPKQKVISFVYVLYPSFFCSGKLCNQLIGAEAVCPHVSERREDFFVLGLDVKGKRSITESLQLYVEGEVQYGISSREYAPPPNPDSFRGR